MAAVAGYGETGHGNLRTCRQRCSGRKQADVRASTSEVTMFDVVFVAIVAVILAVVFTSGSRKDRATSRSRTNALDAFAPVVSGVVSKDLVLRGTYQGHPVEASLHNTGRVDA